MKQLRVWVFAVVLVVASCSFASADILEAEDILGDADLSVGAAMRIRQEDMVNCFDLDSSNGDIRSYFRTRTNLWGNLQINEYDSIMLMLTNEFRNYYQSSDGGASSIGDSSSVVIDNFYLKMDEFMESPVSLTVGRQNLIYGEGFLILEGTPGDGSKTIYFDALKGSIDLTENETLDLIYIRNDKKDVKFLSDNAYYDEALDTRDNTGIVAYLKSKLSEELKGELYFINKIEDVDGGSDLKLNTFGFSANYKTEMGTFRGQFALQDGDQGTINSNAFGGYLFYDKSFDAAKQPMISVGGLWLSGDDPESDNENEGWNPLWSRYPYLNELYAYVLVSEGLSPCYWTNTAMYTARLTITPIEKMKMTMALDYFMAMEKDATSTGYEKGLSPHLEVSYAFSPTVSWKSELFLFKPGNAYSTDDTATFIRHEWNIKF